MFRKVFACLLLLYVIHSSFQKGVNLPDCRDVIYTLEVYNGINRDDAVKTIYKNHIIGIPQPYLKSKQTWMLLPNKKAPANVRIMVSNYRQAFMWARPGKTNLNNHNFKIHPQYRFIVDGWPIWFANRKHHKISSYLKMNCVYTKSEPAPANLPATTGLTWEKYNLFKIPQNAIIGGLDKYRPKIPFYIGIVQYKAKTYIAKVFKGSSWLRISVDDTKPTYITSARVIHILVGENKDVKWKPVDTSLGKRTGRIFRCEIENQYLLSQDLDACHDARAEVLAYKEAAAFLN